MSQGAIIYFMLFFFCCSTLTKSEKINPFWCHKENWLVTTSPFRSWLHPPASNQRLSHFFTSSRWRRSSEAPVSEGCCKQRAKPAAPLRQQTKKNQRRRRTFRTQYSSERRRLWRMLNSHWISSFLILFLLLRQINKETLAHLLSHTTKENNFHRRQSIKLQTRQPGAN